MKGAILSSVVSASVVAAQTTKIPIQPEVFNVAAVNINDPEYTTCSAVADYVGECVTSLGGTQALATADTNELLSCACCVSATPVYPLYSACSSYLSDEGGVTYSDSYSAYSVLYSACGAADICGGSDSFATDTSVSEIATETSQSDFFATTTSASVQTYATACEDMIGIYTSCTNKIDGFTDLPNTDQASCFCCRTRGGTLSWTDELDKYATTCADWAKTGEPETAYSVAQTFESFCERFSDVCQGSASTTASNDESTITSASETTDSSDSNSNTEPVTVTVPAATKTGNSDSAAGSVHVGVCGTLFAAFLAVAMAL